MPKLLLHIGTEKTGTTSIQSFLDVNRKRLKKHGYHVLKSTKTRNHRAVASYCMSNNLFNDDFFRDRGLNTDEAVHNFKTKFKKAFDKEISKISPKIHTVIITSEHFQSRLKTPVEIENLKELLTPHFKEIQVLCYLREQSALAASSYSTTVKAGGVIAMKKYFDNCVPSNPYYNYSELLTRWSGVFGTENIFPRIFDRRTFVNGDLIQDFLAFLDKDLIKLDFKAVDDQNQSVDTFGIMIGRTFNLISPRYTRKGKKNRENRAISKKIFETFQGKSEIISKQQYERIYQDFMDSNIEVSETFLGKRENPFIHNPPSNEQTIKDGYSEVVADLIRNLKHCSMDSELDLDVLRRAAVELEDHNLELSYSLMKMAKRIRPQGKFIQQKIETYKEQLRIN